VCGYILAGASSEGWYVELEKQIKRNSQVENLPSSWIAVTSEPVFFSFREKEV
jgi:hypothetical protein